MRQRDWIAASVVLGFAFLSIMAIVARFLWSQHRPGKSHHDGPSEYSADPREQRTIHLARPLKRLFSTKQERGHHIPTPSGIIKAGDERIYTSALFNNMQAYPGELQLGSLLDAFADELRVRPTIEQSTYPKEIAQFLASTKRLRRGQSLRTAAGGWPVSPSSVPHRSTSLAERGLNRSQSRKTSPFLISTLNALPSESNGRGLAHKSWAVDTEHALIVDGRTTVKLTAYELSALSIILGSQIDLNLVSSDGETAGTLANSDTGAYGVTISGAPLQGGEYRISLTKHDRGISQLPARGSSSSILYAKHLASGSLPFSLDHSSVSSILVTDDTLVALQSGQQLHVQEYKLQSKASEFLARLPHTRAPHFHTLTPSTTSTSTPLLLHTIAELPFTGGLTPLASTSLIQTVQFVASGGLVPGRLLQRLEAVVDKVHRQAPSLQLFGPILKDSNAGLLFRERERLSKLATGSATNEALADKVVRMHRYITLLERLMSLVPNARPEDILAAVREATRKELGRSYEHAVIAYANKDDAAISAVGTKRHSSFSLHTAQHTKRTSFSSGAPSPALPNACPRTSTTSPRRSSTFPQHNLGRQVEALLPGNLPWDVQSIALVARMVLVAWTLSVGPVAWEEGEEGFRVPDVEALPEKMVMW